MLIDRPADFEVGSAAAASIMHPTVSVDVVTADCAPTVACSNLVGFCGADQSQWSGDEMAELVLAVAFSLAFAWPANAANIESVVADDAGDGVVVAGVVDVAAALVAAAAVVVLNVADVVALDGVVVLDGAVVLGDVVVLDVAADVVELVGAAMHSLGCARCWLKNRRCSASLPPDAKSFSRANCY